MQHKFREQLDAVITWCEITAYHWQRTHGNLHNDRDFWQDVMHEMTDWDWAAVVQVYKALCIEQEEAVRRYSKLAEDMAEIERCVKLGKPVVRPWRKGTNHHAFRGWMAIKDCISDVSGTPAPAVAHTDVFAVLFDD